MRAVVCSSILGLHDVAVASASSEILVAWAAFLLVSSGAAFTIWIAQRRAESSAPAIVPLAIGQSPQQAIALRDEAQLPVRLSRLMCCGTRLFESASAVSEPVQYAQALLMSYRAVCSKCGRQHRRYFRIDAPS